MDRYTGDKGSLPSVLLLPSVLESPTPGLRYPPSLSRSRLYVKSYGRVDDPSFPRCRDVPSSSPGRPPPTSRGSRPVTTHSTPFSTSTTQFQSTFSPGTSVFILSLLSPSHPSCAVWFPGRLRFLTLDSVPCTTRYPSVPCTTRCPVRLGTLYDPVPYSTRVIGPRVVKHKSSSKKVGVLGSSP